MSEVSTVAPGVGGKPEASRQSKRVVSLDAARAITIALMIFMDHPTIIDALPRFLVHPEWHGFRLADFVFPGFIFIAGVSLAYSVSRKKELDFRAATVVFLKRIALLILIGLGLNLLKYGLPLRYMGVLQRIGLALLIAWPFTRSRLRWVLTAAVVLLIAHGAVLLWAAPAGVTAGDMSAREVGITAWVDTAVLGIEHTYTRTGFDPEGVLGTLSAGALALLGLGVGMWLIRFPRNERRILQLGLAGGLVAAAAMVLSMVVPVNKQLWTPSFTLLAAGIATVGLVAMYWIADLKGHDRYFRWLVPLGRNALLIYIGSNVLLVLGRSVGIPWNGGTVYLFPGAGLALAKLIPPMWASMVLSAAEVGMWLLIAGWLDRKKLYFKL